jgi:hypothetical protein
MSVKIQSGFTGGGTPLTHPRIGWQRITGTILASTEADGFDAANAGTYRTDSFWRPTAMPATWRIDAGTATAATYCGIAAHNLGAVGATVAVERSADGSTWTVVDTLTPTDDDAIMFLFASASDRYWRLNITGSNVPTIGVISFGPVLAMPQPATYAPSTHFDDSRSIGYLVNETEGGQWAGRSITRQSLRISARLAHMGETFVAADLRPFIRHSDRDPFFIAIRPASYPREVAYAWADGQFVPSRDIARNTVAYSLEMQMTGFLS